MITTSAGISGSIIAVCASATKPVTATVMEKVPAAVFLKKKLPCPPNTEAVITEPSKGPVFEESKRMVPELEERFAVPS